MRYIFVSIGSILVLYATAKVYLVFQHPNVGPELMADATLAALGAIVCFAVSVKVGPKFYGEDFRARVNNRWMLTPLGVALIVIDVMDLVFAVDSIPTVFAITQDPFIDRKSVV